MKKFFLGLFPSLVRDIRIETLEQVFVVPDQKTTYVRVAFLLEELKNGKTHLSTLSDGANNPW
jgi:hypothetical protein